MKKISIFLLAALSIALFSCNKEKVSDESTEQMYVMTSKVLSPDNGSKAGIEGKVIKWSTDDRFYTFGISKNDVVTEFSVISVDQEGIAHVQAEYDMNLPQNDLPYLLRRNMYYLGGFTKTDEMPQIGDSEVVVEMSIAEQTGKHDDIGDYLIVMDKSGLNFKVDKDNPYRFDFDHAAFTSLSSIVKLDLSEYYGKTVSVEYYNEDNETYQSNKFRLTYFGNYYADDYYHDTITNKTTLYRYSYIESQEEYISGEDCAISVTAQQDETYLVILPESLFAEADATGDITDLEMVFKVEGVVVGTVIFPDGLKKNRIYTGPNGDPIRLGAAKAEIEEVAIY